MIEKIFKLVSFELLVAQQIEEDARVEVARARTHRNATSRSKAHRSVDRYPVSKCTETRAVAQMRKDGSSGKLRVGVMHQRLIRNTVEAIASNPCVEIAMREGKVRRDLGDPLVKSVGEAGEMCRPREDRWRGGDGGNCWWEGGGR